MRIAGNVLLLAAALSSSAVPTRLHAQSETNKSMWLATWATANVPAPPTPPALRSFPFFGQALTLRQVVHLSHGGTRIRVVFSNEFGTTPLSIESAHVAMLDTGSRVLLDTDKALSFDGKPNTMIPPGQLAYSDPMLEVVPSFSDLVISAAFPQQSMPALTYHYEAQTTTFAAAGDQVTAREFTSSEQPITDLTHSGFSIPPGQTAAPSAKVPATLKMPVKSTSWYFLKRVEVNRERNATAVVTFGDSITDGFGSTPGANHRWPDLLAKRFAAHPGTADFSVVNEGIGANRILHDGFGPKAMDRFDRDVLTQPGIGFVIMLERINDLGRMHHSAADAITEQQLKDAYVALAQRAHALGVKFIPATILPTGSAGEDIWDGEAIRQHVNEFIRTSNVFDGFIDFDKAVRDPDHPDRLLPRYDHGDHLHLSDEGYAAMAAAINLEFFVSKQR